MRRFFALFLAKVLTVIKYVLLLWYRFWCKTLKKKTMKKEFTLSNLKKEFVGIIFTLNGKEFKILAYFVSQKDRNGLPCKGRQTAIDYMYDGNVFKDISTEIFKNEFFPNREKTTHATKNKIDFEQSLNKLLEKATRKQLQYTTERVAIYKSQLIEKEKAEKAEKIKALKAQLALLENE